MHVCSDDESERGGRYQVALGSHTDSKWEGCDLIIQHYAHCSETEPKIMLVDICMTIYA